MESGHITHFQGVLQDDLMTILLVLTLYFLLLVDLLPPNAEVEPDIRRGPLQDIQQHSDHTDPSRRYMYMHIQPCMNQETKTRRDIYVTAWNDRGLTAAKEVYPPCVEAREFS